jgi:hypothetical protein
MTGTIDTSNQGAGQPALSLFLAFSFLVNFRMVNVRQGSHFRLLVECVGLLEEVVHLFSHRIRPSKYAAHPKEHVVR